MSRSHNGFACTLVLAVLLAAPTQEALSVDPLNFFTRLWEAVAAILTPAGSADEGCAIDPHGDCKSGSLAPAVSQEQPPTATTDEGCMIDPHGGCKSGS